MTRQAESEGTALGSLALPWTFAGLAVTHSAPGLRSTAYARGGGSIGAAHAAFPGFALHCTLAASASMLVSLLLRQRMAKPDRDAGAGPRQPSDPAQRSDPPALATVGQRLSRGTLHSVLGLPEGPVPAVGFQTTEISFPAAAHAGGSGMLAVSSHAVAKSLGTAALAAVLLLIAGVQSCLQVRSHVQRCAAYFIPPRPGLEG